MILVLNKNASDLEKKRLKQQLLLLGLQTNETTYKGHSCLALMNLDPTVNIDSFTQYDNIDAVVPYQYPFKQASRQYQSNDTVIKFTDSQIGGDDFHVFAGPCAVESEKQIHEIATQVKAAGATVLRGGAFKPRSSPHSFQGLGIKGLEYLRAAADAEHLLVISEAMSESTLDTVAEHVDIIQIGARNMQNFHLLKCLGKIKKPIMLKRGLSATYEEWLLSAEYILEAGNDQVMLCERGIRTFETMTRNTLDLSAVPLIKNLSHLPVIVDPSHATGLRNLVPVMAKAAVVAGAHGVMIETHTQPDKALSDATQTIATGTLQSLVPQLQILHDLNQATEMAAL